MAALICCFAIGGSVYGAEMCRFSGNRLAATWWWIAAAVSFAALMASA